MICIKCIMMNTKVKCNSVQYSVVQIREGMGSARCERGRQVEVRAAAANLLPRSHSCPQHSYNAQCTTLETRHALSQRCNTGAATTRLLPGHS